MLAIRSSSITSGLRSITPGLRGRRGRRSWRGLRRRTGLSLTDLTETRSHLRGCKDRSKATWDPRQRSKATRVNVHPPWPSWWCGVGRKVGVATPVAKWGLPRRSQSGNTVCVDVFYLRIAVGRGMAPGRGVPPTGRTLLRFFPENFSSIVVQQSFLQKVLSRKIWGKI